MKQRGQAVIDKIIDTAERLFYTQGYNNTGINQVIEEADIAKASLYHHFETKTDLLVAYVQRTHERWYNRLQTALDKVPNPKDKLLTVFDYHLERQKIRQFGGCPFIKANDEAGTTDPRVLAEIQAAKSHSREVIGQLVRQSGHPGILSDAELTELVLCSLEGAIATASVFKQATPLTAVKKVIKKLI